LGQSHISQKRACFKGCGGGTGAEKSLPRFFKGKSENRTKGKEKKRWGEKKNRRGGKKKGNSGEKDC